MSKPITIHGHAGGPNPWKVALICEELNVPYTTKLWQFPDLKTPEFEKLNPNGRTPAIEDPNTGIVLWESGAIVEYLIDTYDKSGSLTYKSSPEKYYLQQWLHFQMSGQGPYFGQKAWFTLYHPEKLPAVLERYEKEIKRINGVIDRHLKQTGQEYLVGDHVTYADLSFATWNFLTHSKPFLAGESFDEEMKKDLPHYYAWYQRLASRPSVKKIKSDREAAMAQGH